MTADIPPWVKEVQPKVIRVPLTPYSTNGELFAKEEKTERFFRDSWRMWRGISEDYDTPPHVFIMDFAEIKTLDPNNASNGMIYVLGNFTGRIDGNRKPAYVVFNNLSSEGEYNPWQSVIISLEHLKKPKVAIARKDGDPRYQLIGSPFLTEGRHWQEIFARLASVEDWVKGQDFVIESLRLPISYGKQRDYMHWMAKEGVILQQRSNGIPYFRSLV